MRLPLEAPRPAVLVVVLPRHAQRIVPEAPVADHPPRELSDASGVASEPEVKRLGEVELERGGHREGVTDGDEDAGEGEHLPGVVGGLARLPLRAIDVANDLAVVVEAARVPARHALAGEELGAEAQGIANGVAEEGTCGAVEEGRGQGWGRPLNPQRLALG